MAMRLYFAREHQARLKITVTIVINRDGAITNLILGWNAL